MANQRCEPLPILRSEQDPTYEQDCSKELAARKMYADIAPAAVKVKVSRGSGSGFFIEDGSRVVTNSHVVAGETGLLTVETHDHKNYKARIEKLDDINDIAILRLEENVKSKNVLQLGDSSTLRVGDPLYAIGHPLGKFDTYISPGVFKERGRFDVLFDTRDPKDRDWKSVTDMLNDPKLREDAAAYRATQKIMVDVQTEPGNSGGAIVDSGSKAVAIAMFGSESKQYHRYGWEVPVEEVKSLLNGPDKFQFDYQRRRYALEHPITATIGSGVMAGLSLLPRTGGTLMAVVSAFDLYDLAKGTDATPLNNTNDKIHRGLQWTGDIAMIGGAALSFHPTTRTIGRIGLGIGVGANIGQLFVPQLQLVNIKRANGGTREPFLWSK
jgi:Trypsin-like serine proteases, typically periplasmic, contain C-terminal PDZ domain